MGKAQASCGSGGRAAIYQVEGQWFNRWPLRSTCPWLWTSVCEYMWSDEHVAPCLVASATVCERCLCCKVFWEVPKTREVLLLCIYYDHKITYFVCPTGKKTPDIESTVRESWQKINLLKKIQHFSKVFIQITAIMSHPLDNGYDYSDMQRIIIILCSSLGSIIKAIHEQVLQISTLSGLFYSVFQ